MLRQTEFNCRNKCLDGTGKRDMNAVHEIIHVNFCGSSVRCEEMSVTKMVSDRARGPKR
jgi:hypothetical protein